MNNTNLVSRLSGGLFFLSASMTDDNFTFTAGAKSLELDKSSILESYSKKVMEDGDDDDEFIFSNLSKRMNSLKFLDRYLNDILTERVRDHSYVVWHLLELISQISNYKVSDEIYFCDLYRTSCDSRGKVLFIPLEEKYLVISGMYYEKMDNTGNAEMISAKASSESMLKDFPSLKKI